MTTPCSSRTCAIGLVLGVLVAGAGVRAQEPLVRAKAYYAAAAYEEALLELSAARPSTASLEATEVAAYRVFCLLALGRTDEARVAVESLVRADPLYRPTEELASPRVRAFFDEVRRPMLADAALQAYASARQAFDRKDLPAAADGFGRVMRLIDDVEDGGGGAADLRTLAAGFKDLVDAAIVKAEVNAAAEAAAEAEAAAAAEVAPAVPEPDRNRIYSDDDPDVVRPKVVSRAMPQWVPPVGSNPGQEFSGILEVIVDQEGRVEAPVIRESIHPLYDPALLRATKAWRFTPATRDGTPVKYRYRLGVRVGR